MILCLLQDERIKTSLGFYRRTSSEVLEAFEGEDSSVVSAGLKLVSHEIITVPCESHKELMQATDDKRGKYSLSLTLFFAGQVVESNMGNDQTSSEKSRDNLHCVNRTRILSANPSQWGA